MKIRTFMFTAMMLFASFAIANETPSKAPAEAIPKEGKTAETIAKEKFLFAMVDFLDMSKEALREGGSMARDGIKTGVKFAKEQVPIVLREVIAIRRAETLTYFIITLIIIFTFHYVSVKTCNSKFGKNKDMVKDDYGNDMNITKGGVIRIISITSELTGIVICVVVIIKHAREWLLPWIAPRVYLIEYAMELIGKVKN